ncbi:MAG: dihydrofolate reductase family protein [Cyanobacteria bacterium J06635_1]
MRKLKYYVACTVDGFIAHPDGSWDGFLAEGDHVTDYLESFKDFDTVLMGRKTYEIGLKAGVTSPYPMMKQYVISRTMTKSPDQAVELVSDHVVELVKSLKQGSGKDIYLCGGANLASALFAEHLIDEIVLKLSPILFGSGIPLFSEDIKQTDLSLLDSKIYNSGVILLSYAVD